MNTRPKATGCIVTYNNADKIEKVVASILEQTRDLDFRLIISDNMSADGTADIIRQKFPQVTVVENHENGGFGKGHNAVMDMLDSQYHFIINPDIFLTNDAVGEFIDYLRAMTMLSWRCPSLFMRTARSSSLPSSPPA